MICPWCHARPKTGGCPVCANARVVSPETHAAFMGRPYQHRGREALFGDSRPTGTTQAEAERAEREDAQRQERPVRVTFLGDKS